MKINIISHLIPIHHYLSVKVMLCYTSNKCQILGCDSNSRFRSKLRNLTPALCLVTPFLILCSTSPRLLGISSPFLTTHYTCHIKNRHVNLWRWDFKATPISQTKTLLQTVTTQVGWPKNSKFSFNRTVDLWRFRSRTSNGYLRLYIQVLLWMNGQNKEH